MSEEPARQSDYIAFPISELDRWVVDLVAELAPPSRWAAINALRHLNSAWRLRSSDTEMAVFRAITAEEEAATGLFLSLKSRHYQGASRIKHRDHVHKNALIPFIGAVSRLFASMRATLPQTQLQIDTKQNPVRLVLVLEFPNPATGEKLWAFPQPPLHFSVTGQEENAELYAFEREIQQIATEKGVATIIAYIRERANLRNRLLYATSEGYPGISGDIEVSLKKYQRHVFTILRIHLMLDPYPNQQNFIQQCLNAYLKMLKLIPSDVSFE